MLVVQVAGIHILQHCSGAYELPTGAIYCKNDSAREPVWVSSINARMSILRPTTGRERPDWALIYFYVNVPHVVLCPPVVQSCF